MPTPSVLGISESERHDDRWRNTLDWLKPQPSKDNWLESTATTADVPREESWITKEKPFSAPLEEIQRVLQASQWILELPEDWDDEGASAYSMETWRRATDFLWVQARASQNIFATALPAPQIAPADQGSIDLFWQFGTRTLLINFPANNAESATYYGEDFAQETISGILSVQRPRLDLIAWILNFG